LNKNEKTLTMKVDPKIPKDKIRDVLISTAKAQGCTKVRQQLSDGKFTEWINVSDNKGKVKGTQ
jgi:hypothetical protein